MEEQQATGTTAVITLTGDAVEAVRKARERESFGPQHALRLGVAPDGCSGYSYTMAFDDQAKDDDIIVLDGAPGDVKVVVDGTAREYLEGTVLDYVSGLHGAGFKFKNPKAARLCGCGSSFAV